MADNFWLLAMATFWVTTIEHGRLTTFQQPCVLCVVERRRQKSELLKLFLGLIIFLFTSQTRVGVQNIPILKQITFDFLWKCCAEVGGPPAGRGSYFSYCGYCYSPYCCLQVKVILLLLLLWTGREIKENHYYM